jgi:hypothetical protein
MAGAKWSTPSARSSNFAGTSLNNLANGSESAVMICDNSTARDLYGAVTVILGSITPTTGGSIAVRITVSDGTSTGDRIGGDQYTAPLTTGAGIKTIVFPLVRLYPFSLRLSVINSSGTSLAASGNELYITPYGEELS